MAINIFYISNGKQVRIIFSNDYTSNGNKRYIFNVFIYGHLVPIYTK